METFIFMFGQTEFICKSTNRMVAMARATAFVQSEHPMDEPFGWVPSSSGPNIFRMSVGG